MSPDITVQPIVYGSPAYAAELQLRDLVLRQPLGLQYTAPELALDKDCLHFAAYQGERLVGCLLLLPLSAGELKMRQVAVDPMLQGLGIGKKLVHAAEAYGREHGYLWMRLSARQTAVPFYKALHYTSAGEIYQEVTLPHLRMEKRLIRQEK